VRSSHTELVLNRRRIVLIAVVLLGLLVAGGVLAWFKLSEEPPEVRGSSTVEFVTTAPAQLPGKPRPPKVVLAEPWPTYGYDVARTRNASQFTAVKPPFRKLWTVRSGSLLEFPPVVSGGRVFVSQQHGRVLAINAKNGNVIWRHHYKRCAASSPTVTEDAVYVTLMQPWPCRREPRSQSGRLIVFRPHDGKVLWQFNGSAAIESSPLLVGNLLYFGSWDHKLYAIDIRTHRVRWTFEADDELNSSPAYSSGMVFVGSDGGSLYAVDAKTGKERWRAQSYSHFPSGREYFYATPAVGYGRVFIGNTDGWMYAFGASTGNLLWARHAGTYVYTAAALWKKTVFIGTYDGNFFALDAGTGDVKWKYAARGSIHGAPSVLGNLVYFATCGTCGQKGSRYAKLGPRETVALNARNGKFVWRFPDGQYSPVVADSKRLYLSGRAWVYGLMPRATARTP
jgi:outer membrane protein assembly factor BamB